ncbi:MAG: hypothetical protein ACREYF_28545 [Gammaproteobacteria bacterium]
MTDAVETSIENLILARLLTAGTKGNTVGDIKQSLEPTLKSRYMGSELTTQMERSVKRLRETHAIEEIQASSKSGRRARYRLTMAGRQRLSGYLDATYFPEKLNWTTVRDKYVAAKAVGFGIHSAADYKKVTPGALSAMVLNQAFTLKLDGVPTLAVARDAACWKALGIDSAKRFTGKEAFPFLATMLPGVDPSLKGKLSEAILVAQTIGARNPSTSAVCIALLERVIFGERWHTAVKHEAPLDLSDFAKHVQEAANTAPTGRFGLDKVFISHVWRHFNELGYGAGMNADEFRREVIDAHLKGLVTLAEEDLPDRRDPVDINASRMTHVNATYHYVRITRR